jgi:hypothetical protein
LKLAYAALSHNLAHRLKLYMKVYFYDLLKHQKDLVGHLVKPRH